MESLRLSITEYTVLGLLTEGPAHGFALAKDLEPDGRVGQVLTVRQPLVYRALGRLVEAGLAKPASVEPGIAGPQRVIHKITALGERRLKSWLFEPVEHIRDLRIEFLVKLVLLDRSGVSPLPLVERQRAALRETLAAIAESTGRDPIGLWRKSNAAAAAAFLADLDGIYRRK